MGKRVFLLDNTRIGISWNTIVVPVVQPWGNFTAKIGMQFDTLRTELRFFFFSSDFSDYNFTVRH